VGLGSFRPVRLELKREVRLSPTGHLVGGQCSDTSHSSFPERILTEGFSLEALEKELILKAMEKAEQNVSQAARLLGLSRPALAYRLKKMDSNQDD